MKTIEGLEGKVALITGSSRGIGAAIADKFSIHGADVVIHHRSGRGKGASMAKAATQRIRDRGGVAEEYIADISVEREVDGMFSFVAKRFGKVDILVLNAANAVFKEFKIMTTRDWDVLINTNVMGNINCVRRALPLMCEGGNIVFISSMGSRIPMKRYPLGPMKAALESFVRLWALEFFPRKIRVNAICGGLANTDSIRAVGPLLSSSAMLHHEFLVQPEEIASVAVFLCSADAVAVTGEIITVDKGQSFASYQ
ncbi:MAG: SDR family oxidoreductase [Syntrophales bacterium]|jgi:NAD(P)-dependent dehydrogenase (short-subunit alcohol dehydrogenase family)|nr:SDR family oxidoreductase [Syntrophales bacterium]MCK9527615.1 SDR family oxidoreductase [Syntrophales bacterium]MDX9922232.1 SDR family oxidoreductase [Syntrophales bacterium]